jgi:phage tail-like protein
MPIFLPRPVSWRFYIQIDHIVYGEFTECSGLDLEREVTPFAEGGSNTYIQLPGRLIPSNIILRRGMITPELMSWIDRGRWITLPELHFMAIILADADGTPIQSWDITGAYPVNWQGPELSANSETLAIESLELARGSGSGEGGDPDAGDTRTEAGGKKLDIANLSQAELNLVANEVVKRFKREMLFERERYGVHTLSSLRS